MASLNIYNTPVTLDKAVISYQQYFEFRRKCPYRLKLCYTEATSIDFYQFFGLLCEIGKSANVGKIEYDYIINQLLKAFYSTSN